MGAWGHHGDSKWPSKGPAREPRELLEPLEKAGWKIDDFGGPPGGGYGPGYPSGGDAL